MTVTRGVPRPGLDRTLAPAAVHVFAERGFEAATLRDLAAHLGVTVAAIWHHYRTKDDLLTAAIEPLLCAMEAEVSRAERWQPATEQGPDLTAARQLLGGLLDVWLTQREAFAFVSRDLSVLHHPDHQPRIQALNARLRTQLEQLTGLPDQEEGEVFAAAALGALARPVINLDLDLEPHRRRLVDAALTLLTGCDPDHR